MERHFIENNTSLMGIGDVSRFCDIPVHTIRYWENEFSDFLRPSRTTGKQRRYDENDIMKLMHLKKLLWDKNFSIKGTRLILSYCKTRNKPSENKSNNGPLFEISNMLKNQHVLAESLI